MFLCTYLNDITVNCIWTGYPKPEGSYRVGEGVW